jgi:WD40 repeat protein
MDGKRRNTPSWMTQGKPPWRERVVPSDDTLQQVLHFVLERVELDGAVLCFQVCKSWRRELEGQGFCIKTTQICSALAKGGDAGRLGQNALRRVNASTGQVARDVCLDVRAFLQKSQGWKGTRHQWLQMASQEPDASFLSGGATSTAQILGLPLVQWAGKPQGRHPGLHTLTGHSNHVWCVAISRDGKRVVSGSSDNLVKIWNAETETEVSVLDGVR